jgi:hypothetical protein
MTPVHSRWRRALLPLAACLAIAAPAARPLPLAAQQRLTSPKAFFGFNIGDDYRLANYDQFSAYWRKLDAESNRMQVLEIGKTAEGRPQLMAIVTAPENFAKLGRYKEIARTLALGKVDSATAKALSEEGKAVVWIDGGLHATEVLGAHQLIETSWQLVSRNDPETRRILRDAIILLVHANPDGMQLVSNWYMQEQDSSKRNMNIPRLYQKYIGHDNNRDFYVANQPETRNINHVLYWEWFPQIVYNHHQTGPAGTVMFAPPFRDPFNYNYDPMVPAGIDLVGAAMHSRFTAEGKPGVVSRSATSYSTWWNGGLRTMVYFHNMIGLLTETIGNPTPMRIPFVPANQLPRADVMFPIAPQEWHFRQSIDYSLTANYAVLDLAARQKDEFLFRIWRMARTSIERGSRDTWTVTPTEIALVDSAANAMRQDAAAQQGGGRGVVEGAVSVGATRSVDASLYTKYLRDPAKRDPRAYIIPSSQRDFPTAVRFVNALRHAGVAVQRATADFTANGTRYPAGSFVVQAAQAFRPHVLDMFEPQDHPNDFAYPGGPPKRPYDNAGYTLAYQMGVQFDRSLDPVTGPFTPVQGLATPMPGTIAGSGTGYAFPVTNDAFTVVNRLLRAGAKVYRDRGHSGAFWVDATPATTAVVEKAARELGVSFTRGGQPQGDAAIAVATPRIALWDQYGGSMPSGHTRWLLEQYEFPFTVVYPQQLDAGNLRDRFDVIIFPTGAVPASDQAPRGRDFGNAGGNIPAQYQAMTGRVTVGKTVPLIREFLEQGGTVLAIGTSTALGTHLGLPLRSALVQKGADGAEKALTADQFYIPGSILAAATDTTNPIAWGSAARTDVFFDNSPAFRLGDDAAAKGLKAIAWFDSPTPLRSGWAWGQKALDGAVAVAEAPVGKGRVVLYGPEILFRGQPAGTFKWLFNGIYR